MALKPFKKKFPRAQKHSKFRPLQKQESRIDSADLAEAAVSLLFPAMSPLPSVSEAARRLPHSSNSVLSSQGLWLAWQDQEESQRTALPCSLAN